MNPIVAALAGTVLLALSACGDLPAGHVPYQPNAQSGGGAAYLQNQGKVAVP